MKPNYDLMELSLTTDLERKVIEHWERNIILYIEDKIDYKKMNTLTYTISNLVRIIQTRALVGYTRWNRELAGIVSPDILENNNNLSCGEKVPRCLR